MLTFDANGIYCEKADVYIDPLRPVPKALITHAHSDHARMGMGRYMCHTDSVPLLKLRLGGDIIVQGVAYGAPIVIDGVRISFHPSGHIWGAAQIRLEHKGEVWVVSGDYKLQQDGVCTPFETVKCHHFITESTFGLPVYRFPEPDKVHVEILEWWAGNAAKGVCSVLIGYALGKAQRILRHLEADIGPIYVHGAVDNVNVVLERHGLLLPEHTRVLPDMDRPAFRRAIVVAPPSVLGTSWLNRFSPYSTGICSGWMQLRGMRRRRSVDRGFVLSDHCDWAQLNEAVLATGAAHIYVTHGYQAPYARWLAERYGLVAQGAGTWYEQEPDQGGS